MAKTSHGAVQKKRNGKTSCHIAQSQSEGEGEKDKVKQASACTAASIEQARRLFRRNSGEQAKGAVKHKLCMFPPAQVANNTTADGLNAFAAVGAELHKMVPGKQH